LHVIDTGAWDALQALAAAGLLTLQARVVRPLFETGETGGGPPTLTPEQQARIEALGTLARRRARAARALLSADLAEEAVSPLREAALARTQAAAVGRRLPEPATLGEATRPPYELGWAEDSGEVVRQLAAGDIPVEVAPMIALADRLMRE
jgi:hypothetical protein